MSDLHSGSDGMSRAEKIKRIKNSLHPDRASTESFAPPNKAADIPAVPQRTAPEPPVVPVRKTPEPQAVSEMSEWEKKLAQILERKSDTKSTSSGSTAEDILAELDGTVNSGVMAVPYPEPVAVPEPAEVPEAEEIPAERAAIAEAAEEESDSGKKDKKKKKEAKKAEKAAEKAEKDSPKKKKSKKKKTFKQRFLGLFPQKGDKLTEKIRKIVFLISIIAIVVCGYLVGDYYFELWQSKKVTEEVSNLYWTYETTEPASGEEHPSVEPEEPGREKPVYKLLPGAKKLLDMNKDVIGYIKIDGTPVDNVVLRGDNNSAYLDRKISGEKNRAGELFLDWRNHFDDVDEEGHLKVANSENLVIYGHAMKDETMFGSLIKYRTTDGYYSEHPIIHLNSNYSHYTYKIFSVFILDAEDESETKFDCWNKLNFHSEVDFFNFVNEAKRRNIRTNAVDMKYGDQILTLSTCDTYLGDRGRLIIMARRVREGEDPLEGTQNSTRNPNIKWPTMYYYSNSGKYDPEDFVPYNAPKEEKPEETTNTETATTGTTSKKPETSTTTSTGE